jgi:predicted TIM-barrel fold metal-dependent hydrolase
MSETTAKEDLPIIDFRCRPPIKEFRNLFNVKLARVGWRNRMEVRPNAALSPSMLKVGEPEGLALLKAELDSAGIGRFVITGRSVATQTKAAASLSGGGPIRISDELLLEMQREFGGRAIGLHGINLALPASERELALERALEVHRLPGAVIEPGYFPDERGNVPQLNDRRFYPLYEMLVAKNALLAVMSGIYHGPDITANDWGALDRVMQDFPTLKVVLTHGGYPRIIDALALAAKHPNFYLSPDVYMFLPGGQLYVQSVSQLPDQFIFGTAYPFGALRESVEETMRFPVSPVVMEKYLFRNAARVLSRDGGA